MSLRSSNKVPKRNRLELQSSFILRALQYYILAIIKDYGDAFEGFRRKLAFKKSNRGGHLAVRTLKIFKYFCMIGTGKPTRN